MSNERSPRGPCSMTIGTRGITTSDSIGNQKVARFRGTVACNLVVADQGDVMTDPAVVVRERTLDATPEEVWETLTDEVLLEQWLAADIELDLREGGSARFEF